MQKHCYTVPFVPKTAEIHHGKVVRLDLKSKFTFEGKIINAHTFAGEKKCTNPP